VTDFPHEEQPAIRVLAMPADTNPMGDIFGGWLMSQVDIAGSIEAFKQANGRVVTVAVNEFQFLKPVYVGDLVSIFARVAKIGNTSIQIALDAFIERRADAYKSIKVADALITYVAIDKNGQPRPLK